MDPRHLVQLAAILEKGTMSRASQHLHLTQPTLTHNMQILEMQAGARLFERSRLGVRSTPLGELLARQGRSIARGLRGAELATNRHQQGFIEHVRIGTGTLIGAALLPLVVPELTRRRPGMSVTLQSERPQLLVEQLIDREYDLVIAPSSLDRPPNGIERSLLIPDSLGVFCGASHPLAKRRRLTFGEAADHPWVSQLGVDSPFARDTVELLGEIGVEQQRIEVNVVGEVVMLMRVLSQDRHLAVLPRFPINILGSWFPVVELQLDIAPKMRELYLWCREASLADAGFIAVKETIEAVSRELMAAAATGGVAPSPDSSSAVAKKTSAARLLRR